MKRFLEYINEVIHLTNYEKDNNKIQTNGPPNKKWFDQFEKISETPSGHHIMKFKDKYNDKTSFIAHNPKTNQIDVHLLGTEKSHPNGTRVIQYLNLSGREGTTLKAHEFYHHLITHHNYVLYGDMQSEGGRKVWARLSKMPGVHVHGFVNNNAINYNPNKKFLYYFSANKRPSNTSEYYKKDISLVAHKEET